MSKIMRMIGTSEVIENVAEIKNILISDIKEELKNAVQASELRIKKDMDEHFKRLQESQETRVITAIDTRENDIKKSKERKKIESKLAIIYAREKEVKLFYESKHGKKRLTKEGDEVYRMLSETVSELANYRGSNSQNKIANRTTYNAFKTALGLTECLTKKMVIMGDGTPRESVYADIFYRGLVGKFTRFLETEYLHESEAK